jgi:hypothetical protein
MVADAELATEVNFPTLVLAKHSVQYVHIGTKPLNTQYNMYISVPRF